MAGSKAPLVTNEDGNFKHVGNKFKRQQLYREYRKNKRQEKLKRRIVQAKEERGDDGVEKKRVSAMRDCSHHCLIAALFQGSPGEEHTAHNREY